MSEKIVYAGPDWRAPKEHEQDENGRVEVWCCMDAGGYWWEFNANHVDSSMTWRVIKNTKKYPTELDEILGEMTHIIREWERYGGTIDLDDHKRWAKAIDNHLARVKLVRNEIGRLTQNGRISTRICGVELLDLYRRLGGTVRTEEGS